MTPSHPLRLLLLAVLSLGLVGCGGKKPPPGPPPIVPYKGFFSAYVADEIFVFANLADKQKFDIDPAGVTYKEFRSRVGGRVFVSSEVPDLVPRLVVGYEQANDTELFPATALNAPPARSAVGVTTRRAFPAPPVAPQLPTDAPAATAPATAPAAEPGRPLDQLGPVGEPDDGLPQTRPVTRPSTAPNGLPNVAVPAPRPPTRPGGESGGESGGQ